MDTIIQRQSKLPKNKRKAAPTVVSRRDETAPEVSHHADAPTPKRHRTAGEHPDESEYRLSPVAAGPDVVDSPGDELLEDEMDVDDEYEVEAIIGEKVDLKVHCVHTSCVQPLIPLLCDRATSYTR